MMEVQGVGGMQADLSAIMLHEAGPLIAALIIVVPAFCTFAYYCLAYKAEIEKEQERSKSMKEVIDNLMQSNQDTIKGLTDKFIQASQETTDKFLEALARKDATIAEKDKIIAELSKLVLELTNNKTKAANDDKKGDVVVVISPTRDSVQEAAEETQLHQELG